MMRTVLLTGGTGTLGKHLLPLIEKDFKVILLGRANSNHESMLSLFSENAIDIILHAATNQSRKPEDKEVVYRTNVDWPTELLDLAIKYNVKSFFNMDSTFEKGRGNYFDSKILFKEHLYSRSREIKVINVRMEHFFAAHDNQFVSTLVEKFLRGDEQIDLSFGTQKRDFIYVKDTVAALHCILKNIDGLKSIDQFEVGLGNARTIKEIVLLIKELCHNHTTKLNWGAFKPEALEPEKIEMNIQPLLALGWSPSYSLEAGLQDLIRCQRPL